MSDVDVKSGERRPTPRAKRQSVSHAEQQKQLRAASRRRALEAEPEDLAEESLDASKEFTRKLRPSFNNLSTIPPAFRMMTNWEVEMFLVEKQASGHSLTWRDHMYRFLAVPTSSRAAEIFSLLVLIISVASVIMSGIESTRTANQISQLLAAFNAITGGDADATLAMVRNRTLVQQVAQASAIDVSNLDVRDESSTSFWTAFDIWNALLLAFFGIEFLLRLISYQRPIFDIMLWIDLLCLVPFITRLIYLPQSLMELYLHSEAVGVALHLVSSLSALRFLKMIRFVVGTRVMREALRESATALVLPLYLALMLIIFFGSILFAVEYDPTDPTHMPDVTTCWWMMLVTMTTVGYGDFSPKSSAGRILISGCMFSGLVVIAMPIAIVGNNFASAWERRILTFVSEQLRHRLLMTGRSTSDALFAFQAFDSNYSGYISYREFKSFLEERLCLKLDPKVLRTVWNSIDADESGEVKYSEFAAALFPEVEFQELIESLEEKKAFVQQSAVRGLAKNARLAHQIRQIDVTLQSDSKMGREGGSLRELHAGIIQEKKGMGTPRERMERMELTLQVVLQQQQELMHKMGVLLSKATGDEEHI